jgi:hypothetical protein
MDKVKYVSLHSGCVVQRTFLLLHEKLQLFRVPSVAVVKAAPETPESGFRQEYMQA